MSNCPYMASDRKSGEEMLVSYTEAVQDTP